MLNYIIANSTIEYQAAAVLFKEYANGLNINLSFQHFEEEMNQLQKMYGNPHGGIVLCMFQNQFIGCVGIRRIDNKIAELKRMYVSQKFQNRGIGIELLNHALKLAVGYGYEKVKLDTLNTMTVAIKLYKRNGFIEIPAYYYNPINTAIYFEKIL